MLDAWLGVVLTKLTGGKHGTPYQGEASSAGVIVFLAEKPSLHIMTHALMLGVY